ncbi:conserved exported hypothetical protein [Gammaproteobacteria bacterium]
MKSAKMLAFVALSTVLAGPVLAEPIPALSPQTIPPEAIQAIDSVNEAVANGSVPLFDSRVLSIGLGAIAGVLVYNLLPGGSMVTRAVPGAVSRAAYRVGATNALRTMTTSQLPMMTSAVIGALTGDYLYRKNNRMPSISSDIAGRISP